MGQCSSFSKYADDARSLLIFAGQLLYSVRWLTELMAAVGLALDLRGRRFIPAAYGDAVPHFGRQHISIIESYRNTEKCHLVLTIYSPWP